MRTFAELFKQYRLKAGFSTLSEFGLALADSGLIYEDSIFSHWQNGTRLPKRDVTVKLLFLFAKYDAIQSVREANMLLESAGHGYLTEGEAGDLKKELTPKTSLIREQNKDIFYLSTHDALSLIEKLLHQAYTSYYNGKMQETLVMLAAVTEYINLIKNKTNKYTRIRLYEYYARTIYLTCRCSFFLYNHHTYTFNSVHAVYDEIVVISKEINKPELYVMAESLLGTAYYLYGRVLKDSSRKKYLVGAIKHSRNALNFFPNNDRIYLQTLRTISASLSLLGDKEGVEQTWKHIDSLIERQPEENYITMIVLCGTITVGAAESLKKENPFRLKEKAIRWFDKKLYGHGAFEISDIKFELMALKALHSPDEKYVRQLISRGKWIAEIENYVNHSLYFKKFEREYLF